MKGQRVDGVHDVDTGIVLHGLAVAFERVLASLRVGRGIEPLDRDTALDRGGCVAGVVGHASDGAGHELEAALAALPGVDGKRSHG